MKLAGVAGFGVGIVTGGAGAVPVGLLLAGTLAAWTLEGYAK